MALIDTNIDSKVSELSDVEQVHIPVISPTVRVSNIIARRFHIVSSKPIKKYEDIYSNINERFKLMEL